MSVLLPLDKSHHHLGHRRSDRRLFETLQGQLHWAEGFATALYDRLGVIRLSGNPQPRGTGRISFGTMCQPATMACFATVAAQVVRKGTQGPSEIFWSSIVFASEF